MHSFLRAVGFSKIKSREELDKILGLVMTKPSFNKRISFEDGQKRVLVEKSLEFADRIGITVRGEYDDKGFFHLEHYFPYFAGKRPAAYEEISINKRMDTDAYTGMADDMHFGISLIFYLQNSLDYLEAKHRIDSHSEPLPLTLSALSTSAKVLLPVMKTSEQLKFQSDRTKRHDSLIIEAREGSEDAINSLTLDDIDTYAMVSRRIQTEDIYSIVDSSFIPYGSESDNYTIIGEIKEVTFHVNTMTGEHLTELLVFCNELNFYVCMNKEDLIGEPAVGRRFKGNVWLQGLVDFG